MQCFPAKQHSKQAQKQGLWRRQATRLSILTLLPPSPWASFSPEIKQGHHRYPHTGILRGSNELSITTNKASGGDGIPVELFQILKDDAMKSAAFNMPANLESSAVATGLEKVSFHSNPKEMQCQRMFKLPHSCTHLTC